MKKAKNIAVIICMLALISALLTACGADTAEGTWVLTGAEYTGTQIDPAAFDSSSIINQVSIECKDGTATLHGILWGSSDGLTAKYKVDKTSVIFTDVAGDTTFTLKDNTLTGTIADVKLTFARENADKKSSSTSNSLGSNTSSITSSDASAT